jgi:hypothetical protein
MITYKTTHTIESISADTTPVASECNSIIFINLGTNSVNIVISSQTINLPTASTINFECPSDSLIKDIYTIVFPPTISLTNSLMIIRQFKTKI